MPDPAGQGRRTAFKLQLQLGDLWAPLGLDRVPPSQEEPFLDHLAGIGQPAPWSQRELIAVIRQCLTFSALPSGAARWRACSLPCASVFRPDRQISRSTRMLSRRPTPPLWTTTFHPIASRAVPMRCALPGSKAEAGWTLLAYLELDERETLERSAAILAEAGVVLADEEEALATAWHGVVRLGVTRACASPAQRQQHWWTFLEDAAHAYRCTERIQKGANGDHFSSAGPSLPGWRMPAGWPNWHKRRHGSVPRAVSKSPRSRPSPALRTSAAKLAPASASATWPLPGTLRHNGTRSASAAHWERMGTGNASLGHAL